MTTSIKGWLGLMMGCLLLTLTVPAWGQAEQGEQKKLAQTGMKFLSVSNDPRAAAMGSAMTAMEGGSVMLFYNPAGMAGQTAALDVGFGQTQWIADINYNQASLSLVPAGGRFGVIGFSFVAVDYGDIQETVRADNEQGFLDIGTINPSAFAFGVGYARALTDRFSVGGQVKYAYQNFGSVVVGGEAGAFERNDYAQGVLAFDFGVLYRTGFRSLNFAVSARNFAEEIVYERESFQLPLTLKIGLSMDVLDLASVSDMHALLVGLEAENPRDFSEQIKLGGEYMFMNTLALRGGYLFPTDEQGFSLGAGIRQSFSGVAFGADYAYTNFGVFSAVHRIALHLAL